MPDENIDLPTSTGKVFNFTKKALGVSWRWIKENWLLVLVIGSVLMLSTLALKDCGKDDAYQSLFDQYGESIEDHKIQLQEIRTLQTQERLEQDRQLQKFINEMSIIQQQYQVELERVSKRKFTTQNRIIDEAHEDPGTLTRRIQTTFGIPIDE